MSKRDILIRLMHRRDYAQKAVAMTKGQTRDDLDSDEKLRLALTHLVELVGEAAAHVPAETQAKYPEIPWQKAIGMRHRLIHGYDSVDLDILWNTVTRSLPDLVKSLDDILDKEPRA